MDEQEEIKECVRRSKAGEKLELKDVLHLCTYKSFIGTPPDGVKIIDLEAILHCDGISILLDLDEDAAPDAEIIQPLAEIIKNGGLVFIGSNLKSLRDKAKNMLKLHIIPAQGEA